MTYQEFYDALKTYINDRKGYILNNFGKLTDKEEELNRLEKFIEDNPIQP